MIFIVTTIVNTMIDIITNGSRWKLAKVLSTQCHSMIRMMRIENICTPTSYFHPNFTMRTRIEVPPDCKDFSGLPPGSATLVALLAEFFRFWGEVKQTKRWTLACIAIVSLPQYKTQYYLVTPTLFDNAVKTPRTMVWPWHSKIFHFFKLWCIKMAFELILAL